MTALFDGSMAVDVPDGFQNASALRPVPDNQEMFVDLRTGASLVVDVLEAVEAGDVSAALQVHADEVFCQAGDAPQALRVTLADVAVGPESAVRRVACGSAADIAMALVRVPEHSADILMTVHGWTGDPAAIFQSFRIASMSLFA